MLELCLGSYFIIAALATILMISALILGSRADRIRYGLHFWSSLAQATRDDSLRFEIYELEEEDSVQLEKERVRLPRTAPPVDI